MYVSNYEYLNRCRFGSGVDCSYGASMGGIPTAVVGPAIAATAVSTLAAVAFCKVMK